MSEGIRNQMRAEALRAMGTASGPPRIGIVDGADPTTHTVRVRFQPENTPSNWIPVAALSVGAGWGLHALPAVGAQVVVDFIEGGGEAGVVRGGLYSQQQPPPATPVGAIWLTNEAGTKLKLNADGSADLLTIGPELRLGTEGGTFRKLVTDVFMALFNAHSHPGNGAPPTQQMTNAHLTDNTKATG